MSRKCLIIALVVFLGSASIPVFSQVTQHGTRNGLPLNAGNGYSNYHTDWSGRLGGPMFWVDWNFYNAPGVSGMVSDSKWRAATSTIIARAATPICVWTPFQAV